MTIYERIKARRKELGLTADEVANVLGISRATVYRYESSEIEKLPITILEPLAKVLKTTPSYLMGWTESQIIYEPKKEMLISNFDLLNNSGQNKAIDYVSDLADNPKYQKEDTVQEASAPYVPEVLAAHHTTGKLDEEDRDIVNDAVQFIGKLKREKGEL